ncbi:hypothetical protein J5S49_01800 [Virgibacillus halodenitrificans]|uniref:hypothetical protein n=1 Tax=Virgibacillus halodenitrificans TaxID=1482 RepID=UPI001F385099|nr:hypothetical protein [Virgibacillus halodenitrificans]MCG1027023.1 hypothetical protein [Virgibacillus halodenitrificans]
MVQGAINPDENFSKEHWLNSIGLAGMGLGARVPAGKAGSGTKATVNKVDGAKKTPNATLKPKPESGKMTIPTIQTLTGKLNWFKAHLPVLRVVQDSTGGQHYVFSKRGDGSEYSVNVDQKQSPSELAKSWQGQGAYPGIDRYRDITIKKVL